jgi:hypothetical protein
MNHKHAIDPQGISNIEQRISNDEVFPSAFDIPCSIFVILFLLPSLSQPIADCGQTLTNPNMPPSSSSQPRSGKKYAALGVSPAQARIQPRKYLANPSAAGNHES